MFVVVVVAAALILEIDNSHSTTYGREMAGACEHYNQYFGWKDIKSIFSRVKFEIRNIDWNEREKFAHQVKSAE